MTATIEKYKVAAKALEIAEAAAQKQVDALDRLDPNYEIPMTRLSVIRSALTAVRHAPYIGRDGGDHISHMVCVMASEACAAAHIAISRLSEDHHGNDAETNPFKWLLSEFRIHRIFHDDLFAAKNRDEQQDVRMCNAPQWYSA